MSWLSNILGLFSGKGMEDAERARQGQLNQYYGQFQGFNDQNIGQINQNYMAALKPFQDAGPSAFEDFRSTALTGTNAYADASGANGPEGLQRAQANYMMSPGTRSAINEAVANVGRTGVAGGQATGNIQQGAIDRSTDLAMRDFNNYTDRLAPFLGYGLNVAGGLDANQRFGMSGESGIRTGLADALSRAYGVAGQGALGQGQAAGQSAYNQGMAGTAGAANSLDALLKGTGMLLGFAGGGLPAMTSLIGGAKNTLMNSGLVNPTAYTAGAGLPYATNYR